MGCRSENRSTVRVRAGQRPRGSSADLGTFLGGLCLPAQHCARCPSSRGLGPPGLMRCEPTQPYACNRRIGARRIRRARMAGSRGAPPSSGASRRLGVAPRVPPRVVPPGCARCAGLALIRTTFLRPPEWSPAIHDDLAVAGAFTIHALRQRQLSAWRSTTPSAPSSITSARSWPNSACAAAPKQPHTQPPSRPEPSDARRQNDRRSPDRDSIRRHAAPHVHRCLVYRNERRTLLRSV